MNSCPQCLGSIEAHSIENIPCFICHLCEGLYFQKTQLRNLLNKDNISLNRTELNNVIYKKNPRKDLENIRDVLHCSMCEDNRLLKKYSIMKTQSFPYCPNCDFLWLSKGKIQDLRKKSFKISLIIFSILLITVFFWILFTLFLFLNTASPSKKTQNRFLKTNQTLSILPYPTSMFLPPPPEKKESKENNENFSS